jgi:hypothetical protein
VNASLAADSENATVARVGTRVITQPYFEKQLTSSIQAVSPGLLGMFEKRRLLNALIDKELILLEAEKLGIVESSEFLTSWAIAEDALLETESRELRVRNASVSASDVEEFYARKQVRLDLKHVQTDTWSEANDVRKLLNFGADFDSLAIARSTDANVDFDVMSLADTPLWMEHVVHEMKTAGVSLPVLSYYGWHVFKLVSRTAEWQGTLSDERRSALEQELRSRLALIATDHYYDSILADHDFRLSEQALDYVFSKLPLDVDPSEAPAPDEESKPILDFSPEDMDTVLFEIDDGSKTIFDFSNHYDQDSWFERPKRNRGPLGLRSWIRDHWLRKLKVERARRDGVQTLPAVKAKLESRRQELIASMLRQELVLDPMPEPTPEELVKFDQDHPVDYEQGEIDEWYEILLHRWRHHWEELRMRDLLLQWRREYEVEIYEDVLERAGSE